MTDCIFETTANGLWCPVCDPDKTRLIPTGKDWHRNCRRIEPQDIRAIVANSIEHAADTATRSRDAAIALLDHCLSGRCQHWAADIQTCTRDGSGCSMYRRWIKRLTHTGCDLATTTPQ